MAAFAGIMEERLESMQSRPALSDEVRTGDSPPVVPGPPFPALSVCARCGYDLRGIGESGRCPECGQPFNLREPSLPEVKSPATNADVVALVIAGIGFGSFAINRMFVLGTVQHSVGLTTAAVVLLVVTLFLIRLRRHSAQRLTGALVIFDERELVIRQILIVHRRIAWRRLKDLQMTRMTSSVARLRPVPRFLSFGVSRKAIFVRISGDRIDALRRFIDWRLSVSRLDFTRRLGRRGFMQSLAGRPAPPRSHPVRAEE